MTTKRNEENIERLADEVLDSWDMEATLHYARERLISNYKANESSFQEDWKAMIG